MEEQAFEFVLSPATPQEAEELLDVIVAWAESHGKEVGGGVHTVTATDLNDGYLTSAQAAHLVGVTTAHMRRMLEAGQVKGYKIGRDWLILPGAISGVLPKRRRAK